MITLLITLIIVCVVLYCARLVITAFRIQEPFGTLLYVLVILIALVWVLNRFGAGVNLT